MFQILLDPSPAVPFVSEPTISVAPLIAAIVFAILLICAITVVRSRFKRPELMNLTPEQVNARWNELAKMAEQGTMGAKLAVIEADKLLDHVLKSMMMPGETLGERLKMAAYKYPAIKQVWPAHKLRNQLVHDSAFELRLGDAKRALSDFRAALRALNVL